METKKPSTFPEKLFVAHYDHSREDSISLCAELTAKAAIEIDAPEDNEAVAVAEYKLISVKRLSFQIVEKTP